MCIADDIVYNEWQFHVTCFPCSPLINMQGILYLFFTILSMHIALFVADFHTDTFIHVWFVFAVLYWSLNCCPCVVCTS